MKKILIFLISLLTSNVILSKVELKSLNPINVELYKEEIKSDIKINRALSYGITGAGLAVLSFLAYKKLILNDNSKPVLVLSNNSTIDEICELHRQGRLNINQGFFKSFISSLPLMGAQMGLSSGLNFITTKFVYMKNFDIEWVIREKTKIPNILAGLKLKFASLDLDSKMFDLIQFPVAVPSENVASYLAPEFYEIFRLKEISIFSNKAEKAVLDAVNDSVHSLNNLIHELEKVISFMEYTQEKFNNEKEFDKEREIRDLIRKLKDLINTVYDRFDASLSLIDANQTVQNDSNLLSNVFEFSRLFVEIIEEFKLV